MKKMVCLVTSIDFLHLSNPLCGPIFSGQQELSNLDYYFQDSGKTAAQTKCNTMIITDQCLYCFLVTAHILTAYILSINFIIQKCNLCAVTYVVRYQYYIF